MVNDVDINISCSMSKYFWRFISNKTTGIDISNGEMECEILFFEALPDDFYNLIEESGADKGKVKGNLESISGCRVLKVNGNPIHKTIYCYPIFRSDVGEDGFYIVMYDRDNNVTVNDNTAYTDITAICKNIIISLNDELEHTIRGFLIKTSDDYLLAYCHMSNPIVVTNNLIFTRNTKIINVGECQESIGGF